jgi:capsular exopolysaccharide synthesis family protein
MSRFFKALEQAERDRVIRTQAEPRHDEHQDSALVSADLSPISTVMTLPDGPAVSPSAGIWDAAAHPIRQVAPAASPLDEDRSVDGIDVHLVSLLAPVSFAAEQYRDLRHTVEQLRKRASVSIIGVSSPDVMDGKTTAAINLAGALAQTPTARVLVVDADLRRPSVATRLGLGMVRPGLTDAIDDPTLFLEDVVILRRPFNLAVLPTGRVPVDPYETLKSPRFGQILAQARARYDYVVVDTPPLLHVPDCRLIDEFVDAFLLVVTAHKTPRQLVMDALTIVAPAKVVGIIFNRDDGHVRNYRYYYRSASQWRNGGPDGRG